MRRFLSALFVACAAAAGVFADTLELTDGRVLEGRFRGGNAELLHFEIDGVLRAVPVTDIVSVRFPGAQAVQPAGPPRRPRWRRRSRSSPGCGGHRLRIRLLDTLDPRSGGRPLRGSSDELSSMASPWCRPAARLRPSRNRGGLAGGPRSSSPSSRRRALQPLTTGTQQWR
jgi:hypothetical protein